MSIVFLLTHIPNPRINKRIQIAKNLTKPVIICVPVSYTHLDVYKRQPYWSG